MEETDHARLHRELEDQGDEMEHRRDELERETDDVRQDIRSKVSDQNVPGAQDEQEEIIHGREAVEQGSEPEEEADPDDGERDESEAGGSEGAGYREDQQ
jgi:hypothetical protein